ncbi:hypothetical protein A4A49_59197, partial [Nicotiana attenuata]
LRAIGKLVTDGDLVTQALQGLPPSYRTFISGLNATGTLPSFISLRPLLLTDHSAQTALLKITVHNPTEDHSAHTVLLEKVAPLDEVEERTLKEIIARVEDSQITLTNNRYWSGYQLHSRPPPSSAGGILGRPPFTSISQCQICFGFNHSFAANNIPKSFAAMNVEEVQPTIWYPNSGASVHMTNDPSVLFSSTPYT